MEILNRTIDWIRYSNQRSREVYRENLLTIPPVELIKKEGVLEERAWSDRYWTVAWTITTAAGVSLVALFAINGRTSADILGPVSTPLLLAVSTHLQRCDNNERLASVRGVIQQRGLR